MFIGLRSHLVAAFTLVCLTAFAKADSFQFTPTDPTYTGPGVTFSIPWTANQLVPDVNGATLDTPGVVPIQIGSYSTLSVIHFYGDGSGMKMNSGDDEVSVSSSLLTGSGESLSFVPGSYGATLFNVAPHTGLPGSVNISGMLIVDGPVSVTPEPSSFALLGTGLLGAAGVMKRRFA